MSRISNLVWLFSVCSAIVLLAMEGAEPNSDGREMARKLRIPREKIDELYGLYSESAEASRVAMLRVIHAPQSRRSLCEDEAAISKEDFAAGLADMSADARSEFIRLLTVGYDVARLIKRDGLLRKYRPAG